MIRKIKAAYWRYVEKTKAKDAERLKKYWSDEDDY